VGSKFKRVLITAGPLALLGIVLEILQTFLPEENRRIAGDWMKGILNMRIPLFLIVLFVIILYVLPISRNRSKSVRISRQNSDALIIRDEHILGRDVNLCQFIEYLQPNNLVFLNGEPGVGKTWFAQKVLSAKFQDDPHYLPIYINLRVPEWEHLPLVMISQKLYEFQAGVKSTEISKETVFNQLQLVRKETGRTPLVICDQFDDYWYIHQKFLQDNRGPLSNAGLVSRNGFWWAIHKALQSNIIKCVIIAHDSFTALEPVRLAKYSSYKLLGLENHATALVIGKVLANASSKDRELGEELECLRDVITDDLIEHGKGKALPIEMSIILRSLSWLPELTSAKYIEYGRLAGLEKLWISQEVTRAASQLEPATLTSALLLLVDIDSRKLRSRTSDELASLLSLGSDKKWLDEGLTQLERSNILRTSIDPQSGKTLWDLDHEYLIEAVMDLDSSQHKLDRELTNRLKQFSRAKSRRHKREALLGLAELGQFLYRGIRGRISIKNHSRLAKLSARRLIIHPASIMVVAFIGTATYLAANYYRNVENKTSLSIISALVSNDPESRVNAAWMLMRQKQGVQKNTLIVISTNRASSGMTPNLLRAIRGIDPENRQVIHSALKESCYDAPYISSSHFQACVDLITSSHAESSDAIPYLLSAKVSADWVKAIAALDHFKDADEIRRRTDLRKIIMLRYKELLISDSNASLDLVAFNHMGCYLAKDAPESQAKEMLQGLLSSRHLRNGETVVYVLAIIDVLPVTLNTDESRLIADSIGLAANSNLNVLNIWANLQSLWKRFSPADRIAISEELLHRIPLGQDTRESRVLNAFALAILGPEEDSSFPLERLAANCREEVHTGKPQLCYPRILLIKGLKRPATGNARVELSRLAEEIISANNYEDPNSMLLTLMSWIAGNFSAKSTSPLNNICAALRLEDREALAAKLTRMASTKKSDPDSFRRLTALGGEIVVSSSSPQDFPKWCNMINERLMISQNGYERLSLLIALYNCSQRDERWLAKLTGDHYQKQKELTREWMQNGQPIERGYWIAGLNLVSHLLPDESATSEFQEWYREILKQPIPDCGPLAGFGQVRPIDELVKPFRMPICNDRDLGMLALSVSKHAGQHFWQWSGIAPSPDLNAFALWAKKEGADIGPLPKFPDIVHERLRKALVKQPPKQ
jgi:hypothetical protein